MTSYRELENGCESGETKENGDSSIAKNAIGKGESSFSKDTIEQIGLTAIQFFSSVLRAYGQVVFSDSYLSGALVLIGAFVGNVEAAAYSLLGTFAATATAFYLFTSSNHATQHGLYGFNAQLIGMALSIFSGGENDAAWQIFLQRPILVFVLSVVSVLLCDSISALLGNRGQPDSGGLRLPYLTLPFNVLVVVFLGGAVTYSKWSLSATWAAHVPTAGDHDNISVCLRSAVDGDCSSGADLLRDLVIALLHGISEIFILSNVWSGAAVLFGIAAYSPSLAAWAVGGSAIGIAWASALGCDGYQIYQGLYGYNPALTTMAIGGGVFVAKGWPSRGAALIGGILSAAMFGTLGTIMGTWGSPCFTLPFCFATLLVMPARREETRENGQIRWTF